VDTNGIIYGIAGFATLGVIVRPFRIPEYVWAAVGAALLVVFGLLPWRDALAAAVKGTDVYLFLVGMMLLSEVARQEGLFDWLATLAVRFAKGSARRLFLIVYAVGTVVTVFLSNDATAEFLESSYDGQATYVILGHLSESNNLPELARVTAERALSGRASLLANRLLLAAQHEPLAPIYF